MRPPLGSLSPETRHLNLRWTMADIDLLEIIRKHRNCSAEEIATKVPKHLDCGAGYIKMLAKEFSIAIKPSLIKAVGL